MWQIFQLIIQQQQRNNNLAISYIDVFLRWHLSFSREHRDQPAISWLLYIPHCFQRYVSQWLFGSREKTLVELNLEASMTIQVSKSQQFLSSPLTLGFIKKARILTPRKHFQKFSQLEWRDKSFPVTYSTNVGSGLTKINFRLKDYFFSKIYTFKMSLLQQLLS